MNMDVSFYNDIRRLFFGAFFFLLAGCASYQTKIDKPYQHMLNGQPHIAAEELKPKAFQDSKDQLVYLLEYATAQQLAGNLKESTEAFLKAYDMVEIKDFHSLSKITASLLLDEGQIQYKGEDFEKVMVNVYLAINFLLMDKFESAAVEARRVNLILEKFKTEAKKPYDQNPFARYLSGMVWESERNWDSMYLDYRFAYEINSSPMMLKKDLLWGAQKARRPEEHQKWRSAFPQIEVDKNRDNKEMGELIVIYQQGQGPQKRPNPEFHRLPKLYARPTQGQMARVQVSTANSEPVDSRVTETIFSVTDTSVKTLNDQYSEMIAKRVAGVATKAVVADQIGQKNKTLGALAWIAMNASDQADLRQWATLPESFQLARMSLKPGRYRLNIEALNSAGQSTGEKTQDVEFEILPRKKKFMNWRSFR